MKPRLKLEATTLIGSISLLFLVLLPVAVSAAPGDLYVTNLITNTVDVYSPSGEKTVFASGFGSPQGLAFDHAHNLYVADAASGTIYKYDTAGNQTTFYAGLVAPIGLAVDRGLLLIVESGLGRVVSLPLDLSSGPRLQAYADAPIGVAGAGVGLYLTSDMEVVSYAPHTFSHYGFFANTSGVTTVRQPVSGAFDAYVTTDDGKVTVLHSIAERQVIATGLSDPIGMAYLPASLNAGQGSRLYVADRGAGEIVSYTLNGSGIPTVFVSDAGAPNFIAFEVK